MLAEAICAITSIVLLVVGVALEPQHGQCPPGWYLRLGVRTSPWAGRPTGMYTCARPPVGGDDDAITGRSTAVDPPGSLQGRIYCTGGSTPIELDHRTVGCQHRPR